MNAPITNFIIGILSAMLSIAFTRLAIAYSQLPFNSEGRYVDAGSGIVFHQQSVLAFILAAIIFLFTASISFWRLWKYTHEK